MVKIAVYVQYSLQKNIKKINLNFTKKNNFLKKTKNINLTLNLITKYLTHQNNLNVTKNKKNG